jgi:hypothetical protein
MRWQVKSDYYIHVSPSASIKSTLYWADFREILYKLTLDHDIHPFIFSRMIGLLYVFQTVFFVR